ncbi:hypothetical protein [Paenibacillus ehimensis]|uniref:Uncharacterized protein n=1 Tax=Paenibacillus ehimensis TaxID=79264 RepID=A0ABT8VMI0_9BACL|nr:hypothetical protein [Paenibacillus ehimensis]MDO3682175.1 hypothetical protein [Paenibacillus ehimensis]MEC0211851.1 hypothetical protein [Paenibacillus ehimensis]
MEKKSIDFFRTSNTAIEINEMWCPYCEGVFYELDEHALDECPLCRSVFVEEPSLNEHDSETYTLIVDHKTGIPTVIRNDEYEPVLRPKATETTE